MSKYRARACYVGGLRFDSQAEAARYRELCTLEQAGVIADLRVHPDYLLLPAGEHPTGGRYRGVRYVADFQYREGAQVVVEDVKGVLTPVFRLKQKLFWARYPELELRLVRVDR